MNTEVGEPYVPERVLAIGAHADDIDFGASGSVAAWAKAGAHIEYVVITDGGKGSDDPTMTTEKLIRTRQEEQRAAAKILGAQNVHFLGYEDGCLEVTKELKKDLCRLIRQIRPDTVVVMDPTFVYSSQLGFINHPDHRAAGQATLDAVFPLARDRLTFPELHAEGLEPHKVAHVLLISFDKQNCFVDISETFETKLTGLFAHKSQIYDTEKTGAMVRQRAQLTGEQAGYTLAEGFVRIDVPA
jgi:LmbE family N-acetylglucosaminyl deacetylase